MLGEDFLAFSHVSHPLQVFHHLGFKLSPFKSKLISSAVWVEGESSSQERLLIVPIKQELLPFVLSIPEDTPDQGLDLL
jgi:hypothetical protein